MLTRELLLSTAGLAALDSLNPATIAGVALVLLAPLRRRLACALSFVLGAYLAVLVLGVVVQTGAQATAGSVGGGLVWVRRAAFALAALLLLRSAVRRLIERRRSAVRLPAWFGPWTAAPLGVAVTAADLPNAVPYFLAIERIVAAGVATGPATVVLACYAIIYCLPCLVLILCGVHSGDRVRARLAGLYARFGAEGVIRRSPALAALLFLAAAAAGYVASSA